MPRLVVYLLVALGAIAVVVALFRPSSSSGETRPISSVIADAKSGVIAKLEVDGLVKVTKTDGTKYSARKEAGVNIYTVLQESGVDPSTIVIDAKRSSGLYWVIFVPPLVIIGLIGYLAYSLGKARRSNT